MAAIKGVSTGTFDGYEREDVVRDVTARAVMAYNLGHMMVD